MPAPPTNLRRSRLVAALAAAAVLAFAVGFGCAWRPSDVLAVSGGPDRGATVPADGVLTWQLNLPLADPRQAPVPVIVPTVAGTWTWRDATTCTFQPAAPLPAATGFRAEFPADLRAVGGFRFTTPPAPAFRTAPPTITAVRQIGWDADGRITLAISADQALDPQRLAAALAVEGAPVPVAAAALGSSAAPTVTVTLGPDPRLLGSEVGLRLPAGFTGAAGPLGLDAAWATRLRIGPDRRIIASAVRHPAFGEAVIELTADAAGIDPAAVQVTTQPAVVLRVQAAGDRLRISGPFAAGTAYHLELTALPPAAGADPVGRPLAWSGDVLIPARSPGARIRCLAGAPRIETVGLGNVQLIVERNGIGEQIPLLLDPAADGSSSQALPLAGRFAVGRHRLALSWDGGRWNGSLEVSEVAVDEATVLAAIIRPGPVLMPIASAAGEIQ
jgi:hypothetical protein